MIGQKRSRSRSPGVGVSRSRKFDWKKFVGGHRSRSRSPSCSSSDSESDSDSEDGSGPVELRKVFIGNLPFEATVGQIEALCEKFGTIHDVSVPMREQPPQSQQQAKGFAFVIFAEQQQAKVAIQMLNNDVFQGRRLRVNLAKDGVKDQTTDPTDAAAAGSSDISRMSTHRPLAAGEQRPGPLRDILKRQTSASNTPSPTSDPAAAHTSSGMMNTDRIAMIRQSVKQEHPSSAIGHTPTQLPLKPSVANSATSQAVTDMRQSTFHHQPSMASSSMVSTTQMAPRLPGMPSQPPRDRLDNNRRRVFDDRSGGGSDRSCHRWRDTGRCRYGSSCRFDHIGEPARQATPPRSPLVSSPNHTSSNSRGRVTYLPRQRSAPPVFSGSNATPIGGGGQANAAQMAQQFLALQQTAANLSQLQQQQQSIDTAAPTQQLQAFGDDTSADPFALAGGQTMLNQTPQSARRQTEPISTTTMGGGMGGQGIMSGQMLGQQFDNPMDPMAALNQTDPMAFFQQLRNTYAGGMI